MNESRPDRRRRTISMMKDGGCIITYGDVPPRRAVHRGTKGAVCMSMSWPAPSSAQSAAKRCITQCLARSARPW